MRMIKMRPLRPRGLSLSFCRTACITLLLLGCLLGVVCPSEAALVIWWKLDDGSGTTVTDTQGARNGTITAGDTAPTWTTGSICGGSCRAGSCLRFDGGDLFTLTSISVTSTFSYAAWLRPETKASGSNYAALLSEGSVRGIFYMTTMTTGTTNDEKMNFYIGAADHFATNPVPLDGAWHHVAITNNAGSVTFYLDGNTNGTASTGTGAFDPTHVGGDPSETFLGCMDDIRLYNTALTQGDIQAIMAETAPPSTRRVLIVY